MARTNLYIVFLVCFHLLSNPVHAAPWNLTSAVSVTEAYSQSTTFANNKSDSDIRTQINPNFQLSKTGTRFLLSGGYGLRQDIITDEETRYSTAHSFNVASTLEALRERLFFRASSSLAQVADDPFQAITLNNYFEDVERHDSWSNLFGATARQRLGMLATFEVNGDYHYSKQSSINLGSTSTLGESARLMSGPSFRRIPWYVSYNRRQTGYGLEVEHASTIETIGGNGSVIVNRTLSLGLSGGYDRLSTRQSLARRPSGYYLMGNIRVTPSVRTSMDVGYGKRYKSDNYTASLSHKSRKSTWSAMYNQSLGTRDIIDFESRTATFADSSGNIIINPATNQAFSVNFLIPVLKDELVLSRTGQGAVDYKLKKLTAKSAAYYTRREYLVTLQTDTTIGGNVGVTWTASRRATMNMSADLTRLAISSANRRDYLGSLLVGANFNAGKNANLSLDYRYSRRMSSEHAADGDTNRITARFSANF